MPFLHEFKVPILAFVFVLFCFNSFWQMLNIMEEIILEL